MVLGHRGGDQLAITEDGPNIQDGPGIQDRPGIESDGRYARPNDEPPPDPRAIIDDLRRRLRVEEEKSLNAVDAVLGARAAAAQAKADAQETFYRLHVRETELAQLKELLVGPDESAGGDNVSDPSGLAPSRGLGMVGPTGRVGGSTSATSQAQQSALRSLRTAGSAVKRMLGE